MLSFKIKKRRRFVPKPKADKISVLHLSDLEGRIEPIVNLCNQRNGIEYNCILSRFEIAYGTCLVITGDLFDHGMHSLMIAKIIANTLNYYKKERFNQEKVPRIVVTVGNRDTNKLRYLIELDIEYITYRILANDLPCWGRNKVTFCEYLFRVIFNFERCRTIVNDGYTEYKAKLNNLLSDGMKILINNHQQNDDFLHLYAGITNEINNSTNKYEIRNVLLEFFNNVKYRDPIKKDYAKFAIYIFWMQKYTLSCGETPKFLSDFEYRRRELAAQELGYSSIFVDDSGNYATYNHDMLATIETKTCQINDEHVIQSYLTSYSGGTCYCNLLQDSNIAATINLDEKNRILAIHGAFDTKSLRVAGKLYDNLDNWVASINETYQNQINTVYYQYQNSQLSKKLPSIIYEVIRCGINSGSFCEEDLYKTSDMLIKYSLKLSKFEEYSLINSLQNNSYGSVIKNFVIETNGYARPFVPDYIQILLRRSNVCVVLSGHEPHGALGRHFNIPTAGKEFGIWFSNADITYSSESTLYSIFEIKYDNTKDINQLLKVGLTGVNLLGGSDFLSYTPLGAFQEKSGESFCIAYSVQDLESNSKKIILFTKEGFNVNSNTVEANEFEENYIKFQSYGFYGDTVETLSFYQREIPRIQKNLFDNNLTNAGLQLKILISYKIWNNLYKQLINHKISYRSLLSQKFINSSSFSVESAKGIDFLYCSNGNESKIVASVRINNENDDKTLQTQLTIKFNVNIDSDCLKSILQEIKKNLANATEITLHPISHFSILRNRLLLSRASEVFSELAPYLVEEPQNDNLKLISTNTHKTVERKRNSNNCTIS